MNVEKVARDVIFMLESKVLDVQIVLDPDPTMPIITADDGQMRQLFMNLTKNAVEAMPQGGVITIRIRGQGSLLKIEFSDTGCGISPENLHLIFGLHFTTKQKGLGIGLHIVKTIVDRHGGTISVCSQAGQGTTFTLSLPIKQGR